MKLKKTLKLIISFCFILCLNLIFLPNTKAQQLSTQKSIAPSLRKERLQKELIGGLINISDLKIGFLTVPKIGIYLTLKEALEFDIAINSCYSDKTDNLIEGVVIKPWKEPLFSENGAIFYIKKKNPKFDEKSKKKPQIAKEYSEEINKLKHSYFEMINENRIKSLFSKEGDISSHKEIGKYLGLIKQDILEELIKDGFDKKNFEKDEYKFITGSHDSNIVGLLKQQL